MRERLIRFFAGSFVLVSVFLGYFVSPYWFIMTLFVGLNLVQFSITKWCPLDFILKKSGFKNCEKG